MKMNVIQMDPLQFVVLDKYIYIRNFLKPIANSNVDLCFCGIISVYGNVT